MLSNPDQSFKCGPSALTRILAVAPTKDSEASRRVLQASRSTPNGLSLTAVQRISEQAGMDYQMAFRAPGAPVITPAVAHWKVGHYAALLSTAPEGDLHVGDPTFGEDIVLHTSTLDEEASGYFLVPPGPLPTGWRPVPASEGDGVWGRGDTGQNHDIGATGHDEPHAFPCRRQDGGCTTWNVESAVVGLSLHDDPVGYTPPVGPVMRFGMDYSQRDAQQPIGKFNYVNFGNKWTTEWLSYIEDNSGCDGIGSFNSDFIVPGRINPMQPLAYGDCANLYRRGGGSEPFLMNGSFYPGIPPVTMNSYVGPFSHSFLTRIVAADGTVSFTRTLQDGSVETFARTVLGLQLSTPQNLYFMTAVSDPQGNTVTINYDSLMRITSIVDALGQRQ